MKTDIEEYPQFYNLVLKRFSCRDYAPVPLDRDVIKAIVDTARLAPSAVNRQPWTFLVADTPELKSEICDCYAKPWARTAAAFVVVCGDHSAAWHRPEDGKDHTDVDAAIATEHLCLAAASLGVGSCWICNFDPARLPLVLNTPAHIEPIAVVALGYPATERVPQKNRKPLEEVMQWGKF